jgi:hypothetical protein
MKKLLLTLTLLTLPAFAEIPEYLKDGVVTVTLKDGTVHTFSSNDYKVVPRVQQVPELEIQLAEESTPKQAPKVDHNKNQLILHLGVGMNGLTSSGTNNSVLVEESREGVSGLTYCRNLTADGGVCATGMTNQTFTLGLSLEF